MPDIENSGILNGQAVYTEEEKLEQGKTRTKTTKKKVNTTGFNRMMDDNTSNTLLKSISRWVDMADIEMFVTQQIGWQ